jgi:hypothetical protein
MMVAAVTAIAAVFSDAETVDSMRLLWDIHRYSSVAHDGKTFAKLLHLKNGDPISKIKTVLAPLTITVLEGGSDAFASADRDRYPAGILRDDVFLEICCVQPGYIYLQLREGKLINHSAENYRDLLTYK